MWEQLLADRKSTARREPVVASHRELVSRDKNDPIEQLTGIELMRFEFGKHCRLTVKIVDDREHEGCDDSVKRDDCRCLFHELF